MGLLDGKKALIFGVANDHSIAWGIAQALHDEGAEVGFSSVESLIEKRVRPLASIDRIDLRGALRRPVRRADRARSSRAGARRTTSLDILVHALAFAKREDLEGAFVDTSREGFALALDVSAYSLVALAREARPLLRRGSSVMTLTYYGAEKVVANYNVMGVAKAALEASVRYLAADLGPDGVRVNAISAGPDPDARGGRDRRVQEDVRRVRRRRAAARQHHARGRRQDRASISRRTCRARSPARRSTSTAGSTSWACHCRAEAGGAWPPAAIEVRAPGTD